MCVIYYSLKRKLIRIYFLISTCVNIIASIHRALCCIILLLLIAKNMHMHENVYNLIVTCIKHDLHKQSSNKTVLIFKIKQKWKAQRLHIHKIKSASRKAHAFTNRQMA